MSDAGTAVYVLWAVCLVLYMVIGARRRRRIDQLREWAQLHAPLTGAAAASSRLDGALRDAEEGFHVCGVCGFENLKRRIFCLLCGTAVGVDGAGATPQLNKRQRRARMRKEWQRQLDDHGGLRWVRSAPQQDRATMGELPAYKLEFKVRLPEEEVVSEPQVEVEETREEGEKAAPVGTSNRISDELTGGTESDTLLSEEITSDDTQEADETQEAPSSPQPVLQLRSLADVDAEIHSQLTTCEMRLVDAASADPSQLSIRFVRDDVNDDRGDAVSEEERKAERKAFVYDASLPFPSKLVQFIAHSTAVQQPPTTTPDGAAANRILLRVDRDHLLNDSIGTLAGLPSETVRLGFRIAFRGETGVDAGGVYREWLLLFNEAILAPEAGVYTCVDGQDQVFYLNPFSKELLGEYHLAHLLAAGRLLGRALLEGNVTGFHLALPLLKIILGQPVGLHDLEYFDSETHRSLVWLLNNDGVDALGLDFTVVEKLPDGGTQLVELVPCGREIDLTDANKREFVDRKLKYLLFDRVREQLFAFLRGLHEVVPVEMLMLFDADELDYMLSGSDEIVVDDWETHSRYTSNLIDQPVRAWFWELVREMSNEHRRRLLQFATGASRVPLAGFSALTSYDGRLCPFTLKGVPLEEEQYMRSHACFNRLDLPLYDTKQQLAAMLAAVTADDTSVQGFTIV